MTPTASFIAALLVLAAEGQEPDASATPDLRCGGYCLYISLKALDAPGVTFDAVQAQLGEPTAAGYSMAQLDEVARAFGMSTLGVETTCDNLRLREQPFACIALLKGGHFVNLAEVDEKSARIIDPPKEYALPRATLDQQWTGNALLISKEPLVPEGELGRMGKVWWIGGSILAAATVLIVAMRVLRKSP